MAIAGVLAALLAGWVLLRAPLQSPLQLGGPAPPFELPELAGESVALAGYRGSIVFVNFWATWCPPCRDEAPSLERLRERMDGSGFEILAISIDADGTAQEVAAFRDEFGLSFPILLDASQSVYRAYGVTGVPETYLITAEGRVAERFIGPRNWDEPRYENALRRLIGASEAADGS